jgi:hypothetical protein
VDKAGNKKQNTRWRKEPGVEQRWRGQETRTRTRKNTPKGKKKIQGHRAEVERTGDKNKKQEKHTVRTANKNKETPMAGAAVAVKISVGPSCTMQT